MAARALTAAARRVAGGRTGPPLLASCRNGASMNHCYSASAQPQREEEQHGGHDGMTTGERVEAAQNCKNVEVLQGEEHVATVLPDESIDLGGAGEEASWVPDEDTGVFGPADTAATHGPPPPGAAMFTEGGPPPPGAAMFSEGGPPPPGAAMPTEGGSVLDQTVFVREEDMEDVERPAIDMASASSKNY